MPELTEKIVVYLTPQQKRNIMRASWVKRLDTSPACARELTKWALKVVREYERGKR